MRGSRRVVLLVGSALAAGGLVVAGPSSGATGAFGYGSPLFVNSAAPQTLSPNVDFAGEPSVGADWASSTATTNTALYQASNSTYKVTVNDAANPPAVNWSDVSSPYSQFNLDPILATYSKTGTTIAGGDDGACGVMSITHDDGSSWLPTLPCPVAPDHPTVGIGPFHSPTPIDAVGGEAAYFCQQPILNAAPDECSYSHDGGITWKPSVPDTSNTCDSLFGHVKIGPDGTAYIPDANCTDPSTGKGVIGGLTTADNGQTLGSYVIPGASTPSDGFDPSVAVDSGNRLYESWSEAGDYHPVITWSDDHAKTWAKPVDLAQTVTPALTAATFEAAVAGDSGRAAVAYLGTWAGTPGQDPFTTGFHGVWYLFVSYTYDGGATWQTVQATPDPVQRGEIDAGGTTTNGQRNLLDFMDASVTKDGRVVVGYADGCVDVCDGPNGTEAESTSSYATVAYQSAGAGLFAAYDVTPPATAPAASKRKKS
jgi:hypothetical protein